MNRSIDADWHSEQDHSKRPSLCKSSSVQRACDSIMDFKSGATVTRRPSGWR